MCYTEEERPQTIKEQQEKSCKYRQLIKDFAETLIDASERKKSERELFFLKHLGILDKDLLSMKEYFPVFKSNEARYAAQYFFSEKCKILAMNDFSGDGFYPPGFTTIKINRTDSESVLIEGYLCCIYKKWKFIIHITLTGRNPYIEINYKKADLKKVEHLLKDFREFYRKINFYRGEKVELLASGFLEFLDYPRMGWESIILPENLKANIFLNLILPMSHKDYFIKEKIAWRRGVLLGGQPGVGKTQICRILYNELKCSIILATTKALYDENQVKLLFDAARDLNPTLIILEDLDFIGTSRDLRQNPILGELLNQLDGSSPNEGVFVLATSNRPELLDRALANRPSRFDAKLELSLPAIAERRKLLNLFIKDKTIKEEIDLEEVALKTEGLTGAYLKELITYASLLALKRDKQGITKEDIKEATRHLIEKKPNTMVS